MRTAIPGRWVIYLVSAASWALRFNPSNNPVTNTPYRLYGPTLHITHMIFSDTNNVVPAF